MATVSVVPTGDTVDHCVKNLHLSLSLSLSMRALRQFSSALLVPLVSFVREDAFVRPSPSPSPSCDGQNILRMRGGGLDGGGSRRELLMPGGGGGGGGGVEGRNEGGEVGEGRRRLDDFPHLSLPTHFWKEEENCVFPSPPFLLCQHQHHPATSLPPPPTFFCTTLSQLLPLLPSSSSSSSSSSCSALPRHFFLT